MQAANDTDIVPIGRKIEGVRRLRGMTQTHLGCSLGVSKQAVSKMEQAKHIDDEKISQVAKALHVTADAIHNFNQKDAFNIIANTYHNHSSSTRFQFNPIEKIATLCQEKIELYERMLKEKNELIEKLTNN